MNRPRSFQEWVHWMELGAGARWVRRLALSAAIALLSLWICNKQFHGPKSENTLRQAVVGRQIADGQGYTTLVNDAQTAAILQRAGRRWDAAFPELHEAPLYPAAIGGVLKLLPEPIRSAFFTTTPTPPDGFLPDYVLLGLNVVFLWIAAGLTYTVGAALFDRTVGLVSMLAVVLSSPIWQEVVAVNGTSLAMVLVLALVRVIAQIERRTSGDVPTGWLVLTGVFCGLLFLTDYANGLCLVPVAAYFAVRFAGQRIQASLPVVLGFLVVAAPWCSAQISATGSPIGLAWQDWTLKVDATAADPAIVRATFSTAAPTFDVAKIGNKVLSGLQSAFADKFWSGGALWFAGFFAASLLYVYRDGRVNALRALVIVLLLTLILANVLLDSGEGERFATTYAAPLLIVFGVGFCSVLIASSDRAAQNATWIFAALLLAQAAPLAKDALEPRRFHFQYPPYYPPLFLGMREEMWRRSSVSRGWMADVPAGAAWYSGQRVWGQTATLHDFYAIGAEQPMLALVLTPHTLDRPFFTDLARESTSADRRVAEWSAVYRSLVTGQPAAGFPLSLPQKIADNFYVLIDPYAQPVRRR